MNPLITMLNDPHSKVFWACWAVMLVFQNYAFTFVSRARNSGSLSRHMRAALMSNSAWFLQSLFVYSAFLQILTGKSGLGMAIVAGIFYTAFTMGGSLVAHYHSLKKEKGLGAVGASKNIQQITPAEWASLSAKVAELDRMAVRGSFDIVPACSAEQNEFLDRAAAAANGQS